MTTLNAPTTETPSSPEVGSNYREAVEGLMASLQAESSTQSQRSEKRHAFPYLVRLLPVDPESLEKVDEPLTAVGKQISQQGLGFYHKEPLPFRHVVVTIADGDFKTPVHLLMDLTWCHFRAAGWYESGGRFIRRVSDPQV